MLFVFVICFNSLYDILSVPGAVNLAFLIIYFISSVLNSLLVITCFSNGLFIVSRVSGKFSFRNCLAKSTSSKILYLVVILFLSLLTLVHISFVLVSGFKLSRNLIHDLFFSFFIVIFRVFIAFFNSVAVYSVLLVL